MNNDCRDAEREAAGQALAAREYRGKRFVQMVLGANIHATSCEQVNEQLASAASTYKSRGGTMRSETSSGVTRKRAQPE